LWHGSSVTTADDPRLSLLDPRDRAYAEELAGDEREIVVSTVARYRRPDSLGVGDPLPDLAAARLDDGTPVAVREMARERPLLLVFGSFT
jgi:hypothetical protein